MQNAQKVKKVLIWILFANILVALTKIALGSAITSSSLVADGYHSMSDGLSNVAGLIGIYLAMRPVDRNHPYGHKKYENITGLFIGGVLFVFSLSIAKEAVERIGNPVVPQVTLESLVIIVVTLFINIFVATYEYKKAKELDSDILLADSLHTKSDILVTCGVLATLLAVYFGAPVIIDSVISLVIVVFIWIAAFNIVKKTSSALVDSAAVEVEKIKQVTLSFTSVVDVHAIRSRRSGNDIYVDMHIWVDPQMSIEDAHYLVHKIENKLKEEIHPDIHVLIHPEPAKACPRKEHL